ncbi:hypothetical protein [uncultured Clostridium sp.]|uniref:hypothetical protein n=1 Tax=uncultured Clostridium sp. TaxID=59620 RepID=UPI0025D66763|nr:hypothetical protein [uncultured Clostridium sp.]
MPKINTNIHLNNYNSIVFYVLDAIVGFANACSFSYLKIWSIIDLIFAACLLIQILKNGKKEN